MSSPQLDEEPRSRERAALDIAVKALRKIDLLAAEMGYPDTLGFEDARERILGEIAAAIRGIGSIVPGSWLGALSAFSAPPLACLDCGAFRWRLFSCWPAR